MSSTLDQLLGIFRAGAEPSARKSAQGVVRSAAERFKADISAFFLIDGDKLELAGGVFMLGDKEIPFPETSGFPLEEARRDRDRCGLAPYVAVSAEPLWIASLADLKTHGARRGTWDEEMYGDGIADSSTGFGCLYAVPLREYSTELPDGRVIGVFRIERRASRPAFSEEERVAIDIAAMHLSEILSHGSGTSPLPPVEKFQKLDIDVNALVPSREATQASAEVLELLAQCRDGFDSLSVEDAAKQEALRNLERWLSDAIFEEYRPQLRWMIEAECWPLLLDSFFRVIPFGTGGRRGPVGIGTNRFNPVTLASSVQGHAQFLREFCVAAEHSVVVVYDVREFFDLRGLYNPDLPNPLLGLTSRDFARMAAEVYTAMNIRVYMPPESTQDFVSTPELSFGIRRLGTSAGLNISASHNHPDDNGGKFYNQHGSQHVPPSDEDMAQLVQNVRFLARLDGSRARAAGLLVDIPEDVHRKYIQLNLDQSLDPEARSEHVVFAPLHGTGSTTVAEVLADAGFTVTLVPEQSTPDGRFPAVPFRAPNPEVPESMEMGTRLAASVDAGLVMACDPDADRIGVCCKRASGGYRFFNGNEISVLVTHYKLERLKELGQLPHRPLVLKTEVTTELLDPVSREFGATINGNLLVGFKYHGHVLECVENGEYGGGFQLGDFIAGVEESHGVLVTHDIRDKDAAGAAILLAELSSRLKQQDRTLETYLDEIYKRYGYHANRLVSLVMTGAEGLANLRKIQETLRANPPEQIGGRPVASLADHWDESGAHGPIVSSTDRASRDVLVFRLEGGARLILRPSGTEPKSKTYVEVVMPALGSNASDDALEQQKRTGDEAAREIADDLTEQMLEIIGVRLPRHAMRVSGLVGLDQRIDFAEAFLPELVQRTERVLLGDTSREDAVTWIENRLAPYGKDAPGLVAEGVAAYLSGRRSDTSDATELRLLDELESLFAAAS